MPSACTKSLANDAAASWLTWSPGDSTAVFVRTAADCILDGAGSS